MISSIGGVENIILHNIFSRKRALGSTAAATPRYENTTVDPEPKKARQGAQSVTDPNIRIIYFGKVRVMLFANLWLLAYGTSLKWC